MDGKQLTRFVLDSLDEEVVSGIFAGQRQIYDYLDLAASTFCRETRFLTSEAAITTVADRQTYDLPPDFIGLYMKDSRGRFFIKYYDTSNYLFPIKSSYEKIFKSNLTTAKPTPGRFCIRDDADNDWGYDYINTEASDNVITETAEDYVVTEKPSRGHIRGSAEISASSVNGDCQLTDSSQSFNTTVKTRDVIHNTTDGSSGIVLKVIGDDVLVCALFDGAENDWTEGDDFVIIPSTTSRITLDAPSETAGHTITVPYVCMPFPVYSEFCVWKFPDRTCAAIAQEAAFLYMNQKGDFPSANRMHELFIAEINRFKRERALLKLQDGQYRKRF
ncbi:MAG: hypothetical protein ABIL06_13290 [Pseudomonadota bacterium]|uniref:Uncharacterized protein n=1 Tax=viral metagenome TaxID=1070528 RepID=A0A6M3J260_9ZZZZ